MQEDIAFIFNRFVGREVEVTEDRQRIEIGKKKFDVAIFSADRDPIVNELRATAELYGLKLMLWLPSSIATMVIMPDRLNVHVRKGEDGKYRIGEDIHIDASTKLKKSIATVMAKGTPRPVTVSRPLQLKKPLPPSP